MLDAVNPRTNKHVKHHDGVFHYHGFRLHENILGEGVGHAGLWMSIISAMKIGEASGRGFIVMESDVNAETPWLYPEDFGSAFDVVRVYDHPETTNHARCSEGALPVPITREGVADTWASGALFVNHEKVLHIMKLLKKDVGHP